MSQIITVSAEQHNSPFDAIRGYRADGSEYWTGRELTKWLEYKEWRNGEKAIKRAIISCRNNHEDPALHIVEVNKVVHRAGSGSLEINDYELSRFGCYLVAQNADPEKEMVAMAQGYFATTTYKSEVAQQTPVAELSRLEILQLALSSEQEKLALQAQIEADRPATELGKAIEKAETNIRVGDFAKIIGTGQNRYFDELRECKIIMATGTLPYQRFLNDGYFVVTEVVINNKVYPVALITPKGQAYLVKRHQQYLQAVSIECQIETAFVSALV